MALKIKKYRRLRTIKKKSGKLSHCKEKVGELKADHYSHLKSSLKTWKSKSCLEKYGRKSGGLVKGVGRVEIKEDKNKSSVQTAGK